MREKRKVLLMIDSFQPGGSETQAVQLLRLLGRHPRYEVHVACLRRFGMMLEEVEAMVGEVPAFPLTSFYDRNMIVQLSRLAGLLRSRKIDVIHTSDFYTNVLGISAAWLARTPARVASRRETAGFRTPAQKRVERAIFSMAHAVVANAEAVRAQVLEEGAPAAKVVTLYNGLDPARVKPSMSRDETLDAYRLPREERLRFITIVANMVNPVKDHPMFLRAARRVRDVAPEARFIIVGEGALTDQTRALAAKLGLANDVFFTARCEQVADVLSVSDICVLSSKAEGFSNSILEYMAASRPAVVTDVGGAREAITDGETGYLVQSGDDFAMAERIISLLREPERMREMGRRARQVVEQKFSTEARLANTVQLYDKLLARTTSTRAETVKETRREGA